MPLLGSIVQKGKLAAWALAFSTSALNSVDFPTFGRPTIPAFIYYIFVKIGFLFCYFYFSIKEQNKK
jgi:hypothetical protein